MSKHALIFFDGQKHIVILSFRHLNKYLAYLLFYLYGVLSIIYNLLCWQLKITACFFSELLLFLCSSISTSFDTRSTSDAKRCAERQNLISIKSNARAEPAVHGSCSFLQLALFIFPRFQVSRDLAGNRLAQVKKPERVPVRAGACTK